MEILERLYPVSIFLLCLLWTLATISLSIFIVKMTEDYDDIKTYWKEQRFAVILHLISIVLPIMHTCLHLFIYYKAS